MRNISRWVANLAETFRESGIIDVFEHRKETDLPHSLLHKDVILSALEEMSYRALGLLGDAGGQALRESLVKADSTVVKVSQSIKTGSQSLDEDLFRITKVFGPNNI